MNNDAPIRLDMLMRMGRHFSAQRREHPQEDTEIRREEPEEDRGPAVSTDDLYHPNHPYWPGGVQQ